MNLVSELFITGHMNLIFKHEPSKLSAKTDTTQVIEAKTKK